jgi:hypothetical protein
MFVGDCHSRGLLAGVDDHGRNLIFNGDGTHVHPTDAKCQFPACSKDRPGVKMADTAPTKAPTVEAATEAPTVKGPTEAPTVEGPTKDPAVEGATVEGATVEAPTKAPTR